MIWTEFLRGVCHPQVLRILPPATKDHLDLRQWGVFRVQRDYRRYMLAELEKLLGAFGWRDIPFTRALREQALDYLDRYYLDSNDAIHLASAMALGIRDFASFDKAFRPVDGLALWNDRMHRGRPPEPPETD